MNRLSKIRQLPCTKCHAPPPSQACHANWGGGFFKDGGKGMGIKADDEYTIPLCHVCHRWLDQYQELDREQAKAWFMEKWELTNHWLTQKEPENGVDF